MADPFGYHGDGFEGGERVDAHFPSLPAEGDPFLHGPVTPMAERHGDWDVYNPCKDPVSTDEVGGSLREHGDATASLTDDDIIAQLERYFR